MFQTLHMAELKSLFWTKDYFGLLHYPNIQSFI